MSHPIIYGIKNCDTMKKAFAWLDSNSVQYTFHDYKKLGMDESVLKQAIAQHGWENVINRRGTTWRMLPDTIKTTMNADMAESLAKESPSIVKRPLLVHDNTITLGFSAEHYRDIF